ncbi:50S ribosomal protein L12 [Spatholobus suberectus]|nr:50S ribosomal protein L12 [Spatholobus suberectus]
MSRCAAKCTTRLLSLTRALSTEARAQKVERIAGELLDLNRFERHDFAVLWRLKMGLHRYGAPVAAAGVAAPTGSPAADAGAAAVAAEKTAFDLKLEKYDAAAKIKIIKEVRAFTDLGLKEAKDLVEKVPCVLKKGLTKEEASTIMEKLKELGAAVVLE